MPFKLSRMEMIYKTDNAKKLLMNGEIILALFIALLANATGLFR